MCGDSTRFFIVRNGLICVGNGQAFDELDKCDFVISKHNDDSSEYPYSIVQKANGKIDTLYFMNVDEILGYLRGYYMTIGIVLRDDVVYHTDQFILESENVVSYTHDYDLFSEDEWSPVGMVAVTNGVVGVLLSPRVRPIFVANFIIRINPNGSVILMKNAAGINKLKFKNLQEVYGYIRAYYALLPQPYVLDTKNVVVDMNGHEFKNAAFAVMHREPTLDETIEKLQKVGVL